MMRKIFELADEVRWGLYAFTVLGTPVVAYLAQKGVIGGDEVQLWSAEVVAASTVAASHVRDVVKNLRAQAGPATVQVGVDGQTLVESIKKGKR